MKLLVAILILFWGIPNLWASETGFGGGTRTLNSLQAMQRYDFGLTTSIQDSERWSNWSLLAHSAVRLTPHLELFGRFPMIQHQEVYGTKRDSRTGLGDLNLGLRMTVLRSLFFEDAYPNVSLLIAAKVPTGLKDAQAGGLFQSRSGNGLLEPTLGISVSKDFHEWIGTMDVTYTRLQGQVGDAFIKDNQINLVETLGYSLNREWQLGGGSNQLWSFGRSLNHVELVGEQGRSLSLFTFVNYFVSPFTSLGAHVDWSVESLTRNQPNSRTASISMRYRFY